jgi:transcriptional regulator with XRE-family HTH domain
MKFQGGEAEQRGVLRRRHIAAWAIIPIGKEADNLEEREAIGGEDDPVHWSMAKHDRARIAADIEMILKARRISDRSLCSRAGVSHHTLADLRASCRVTEHSLLSLAQAAEELRLEAESIEATQERWRSTAEQLALEIGGVSKLASRIGVTRQYLNRVLTGKKAMTPRLEQSIEIMARAEAGFLAAETG